MTYGSYAQPVIARLVTTIRPALKLSLVLKPTCISVSQESPDSSEYPGDVRISMRRVFAVFNVAYATCIHWAVSPKVH